MISKSVLRVIDRRGHRNLRGKVIDLAYAACRFRERLRVAHITLDELDTLAAIEPVQPFQIRFHALAREVVKDPHMRRGIRKQALCEIASQ